jgi:hypothetical protein
MRRHLFVRIMNIVEEHDDYFVQKRNVTGTLRLSCLQKVNSFVGWGLYRKYNDDLYNMIVEDE